MPIPILFIDSIKVSHTRQRRTKEVELVVQFIIEQYVNNMACQMQIKKKHIKACRKSTIQRFNKCIFEWTRRRLISQNKP